MIPLPGDFSVALFLATKLFLATSVVFLTPSLSVVVDFENQPWDLLLC